MPERHPPGRTQGRADPSGPQRIYRSIADEHQGEYIPKRAQRLAWLTGFTGSAGIAVILRNTAAVFVDGRYILQAADQIDESHFEIVPQAKNSPGRWLANNSDEGGYYRI